MPEPTLYERLGGVYAISAVIDYFSDQVLATKAAAKTNPRIEEWNRSESRYRLQGLKFLRTLWLCAIAGGPFQYTGLPLGDAHVRFEFLPEEFDEVAAVLASSLDHFHVGKREKDEVLAAFASFKPAVTSGAILRA
jgi:hemoglobin